MEWSEVYIRFADSSTERSDDNYENVELLDNGWVKIPAESVGAKTGGAELYPPSAVEVIRTY